MKRRLSRFKSAAAPAAALWIAASLVGAAAVTVRAATDRDVQTRMGRDVESGRPIVAHLVVVLCDNEHQGIVRVPAHLGNGRDPRSNLYWGARYGVKTFLQRHGGWTVLPSGGPSDERILERIVLFDRLRRAAADVPVYIVADAWDGAQIRGGVATFLSMAAGGAEEEVIVMNGSVTDTISAGGAALLVGYVGHNGLMDFSPPEIAPRDPHAAPNSSIVLACDSKSYFLDMLRSVGTHPLLLTTGLMAPEAYTLDAAIRAWIEKGSVADVLEAAAQAYRTYQTCTPTAARNLFWGASP
jgi:hypothetical protein